MKKQVAVKVAYFRQFDSLDLDATDLAALLRTLSRKSRIAVRN